MLNRRRTAWNMAEKYY